LIDRYSFQEGIPEGFKFDFDSGIFHNPKHLQLQSITGWHTYVILNNEEESVVALLHVHIEKENARSPLRSPFGSILFSKTITSDILTKFVTFVELKLKERGVKKLTLKNPPEIYLPEEGERLRKVLTEFGYESNTETSAVIPVLERKFESTLHYSARKKVRKCEEAGFAFNQLTLPDLPVVYQFLKTSREEKKYSLSMSLEEITRAASVFPDAFFLTSVTDKNQLVAANISIQVNSRVLYNFYHDHLALYDAFSPLVFLNKGLYQICQQRKLELLDLGTSQIDGGLNESLHNFKLKLGAQPSNKLTFVKNLS
jgi:hypothetical protein